MNTKNNRRAQETRQRIQSALLELLEEQELDQISVSQLCRRADVNRSTFYTHYDDVIDLMWEIEQGIGEDIITAIRPYQMDKLDMMSRTYLLVILERIRDQQRFYRAYLGSAHGRRQVEWGFGQLLESVMRPFMHQMGLRDETVVEYYFTFFKEGMISVVHLWVDNGCRETPEQMAEIIYNMAAHPAMPI